MTRPRLVNYGLRMTIQVNVYEAKTQLSELLKQAEADYAHLPLGTMGQ